MHTLTVLSLPHPFQLCHQGVQIFQRRLCHTQSEGCQTSGRRRGLSFTLESKDGALLLLGSRFPPSAPHTGQVAFTTSGAPTNHVFFILSRFHDSPPGGTLCKVLVLGSAGLGQRPLLPIWSFWFSSCLGDGHALPGFFHSVRIYLHFWSGLTVALLRFVLVATFLDLPASGPPSMSLCW